MHLHSLAPVTVIQETVIGVHLTTQGFATAATPSCARLSWKTAPARGCDFDFTSMTLSIAVTMGRSTAPLAVFQAAASWAADRFTAAPLLDLSNHSSRFVLRAKKSRHLPLYLCNQLYRSQLSTVANNLRLVYFPNPLPRRIYDNHPQGRYPPPESGASADQFASN